MKHNIRITFLIILALGLSIYSFTTSYSALTIKDDGIAVVKEEVNKVDIELKEKITSSEVIAFLGEPILVDNQISFSIGLDTVNSFGQIYFDINNSGDFDNIYNGIEVIGLDDYKDFINIEVIGINEGDKIEKGSMVRNLSLKITYSVDMEDVINLNDIIVKFIFEKV